MRRSWLSSSAPLSRSCRASWGARRVQGAPAVGRCWGARRAGHALVAPLLACSRPANPNPNPSLRLPAPAHHRPATSPPAPPQLHHGRSGVHRLCGLHPLFHHRCRRGAGPVAHLHEAGVLVRQRCVAQRGARRGTVQWAQQGWWRGRPGLGLAAARVATPCRLAARMVAPALSSFACPASRSPARLPARRLPAAEFGYSTRMCDLMQYIAARDSQK